LAELLASQKLNENTKMPVYGVVTDGETWHFGKLVEDLFIKNESLFAINNLKEIFGSLNYIIRKSTSYIKTY
jgi:hypothetical protein